MITENDVNKILFEIVTENKVPLNQEGLDFITKELYNRLPKQREYEVIVHELSDQDISEHRMPKVEVKIK